MRLIYNPDEFLDYIYSSDSDISVRGRCVFNGRGLIIAKLINDNAADSAYRLIAEKAIRVVSQMSEVSESDILSGKRDNILVISRWLICYYLHNVKGYSTTITGKAIHRDHATVVYGIKQIERAKENPNRYRLLYHFIERFETRMLNEQEIN